MNGTLSYSESIAFFFHRSYRQQGSCRLPVSESIMPGFDARMLDIAVYLYPTIEDAEHGRRVGGTGFLVEVPSEVFPQRRHLYAVSNQHVVLRNDGTSSRVIRFGRAYGESSAHAPLETLESEWRRHPDGDDLAVCYLNEIRNSAGVNYDCCLKESELAYTFQQVREGSRVMLGDDVFMVGRYIDKDGLQYNEPSIRFGNISMFPGSPLELPDGRSSRVFFVDLRSQCGYSGSPVFAYVTKLDGRIVFNPSGEDSDGATDVKRDGLWLLGVDAGHHSIIGDVWDESGRMDGVTAVLPSGMARVVPAWKLREMLDDQMAVQERLAADDEYRKRQPRIPLHRNDQGA